MRVTDAYRPQVESSPAAKEAAAPTTSSAEGAAGHGRDSVKLQVSDKARELALSAQKDEARIEKLRQSIADGTFKVDAHAIAAKIVGDDG
jgi:flagellar biosynthesis anti-sigma factor FlgM